MAKVMLICGKIASGKSFYCRRLREASPAVLLSVDELTARLGPLGEIHDQASAAIQDFMLEKAGEIAAAGVDVILDWGFWTQSSRQEASAFFAARGIETQWHYIDVPEERWRENIARRNAAVLAGEDPSYYVDEGLLQKLKERFQPPAPQEVDVWYCLEP